MSAEKTSLDEVLAKFGIFDRYHLQFIFLAVLAFSYTAMFSQNYIFAVEEVNYSCYEETFINATCGIVNGKRCTKWIYDNPHSFMAEFNLACQEWKRTLVGTVHIFGYMVGLFIIGPLSDRIGRKQTLVWTAVSGALVGVARSYANSYWLYITLEFLTALVGDNYSPLYVLSVEMVSTKKRVIFSFLCTIGHTIGGIILDFLAWSVSYWRNLVRAVHSPAFFFIIYLFLIDESPRWLLSKGKKDKAIAVVEKIGNINKMQLDTDNLDKISIENKNMKIGFINLLKMSFQSRTLVKRCLICTVWWTASIFVYHGMLINTVSLQGNKYVNYGLNFLVHIPGKFIIMYIIHNYKRKIPLLCSFFAAALLCFSQPFLPSGWPWLSVAVYIASSLMTSCFFAITYIYTSELFPTYTRNSMQAMCSSIGRIGALAAPQTPLLLAYWSGLPTLVFGAASLTAGLVTFLVPDTADDALPDTVREAEEIGNKKKRVITGIDNLGMTPQCVNDT